MKNFLIIVSIVLLNHRVMQSASAALADDRVEKVFLTFKDDKNPRRETEATSYPRKYLEDFQTLQDMFSCAPEEDNNAPLSFQVTQKAFHRSCEAFIYPDKEEFVRNIKPEEVPDLCKALNFLNPKGQGSDLLWIALIQRIIKDKKLFDQFFKEELGQCHEVTHSDNARAALASLVVAYNLKHSEFCEDYDEMNNLIRLAKEPRKPLTQKKVFSPKKWALFQELDIIPEISLATYLGNDDDIARFKELANKRKMYRENNGEMWRLNAESLDISDVSNFKDIFSSENAQVFLRINLLANNISCIKKESFALFSRLQHLYLANNPITTIEPGAFDGLANLEVLMLQLEDVKVITPGVMRGLSNLEYFLLYINQHSADIVPAQEGLSQEQIRGIARAYIRNKINQSLHPDRTVDQCYLQINFLKTTS